mgnify:CR=1 FL=1
MYPNFGTYSRKGCPYDNACIESFLKGISVDKMEKWLPNLMKCDTIQELLHLMLDESFWNEWEESKKTAS